MSKVTITWKGFKLDLHPATIFYLGGVDPVLQWETRGISAHNIDTEKQALLNEQMKKAPERMMGDPKSKRKTQAFIDEVGRVMDGLLVQGQPFVRNYLGDRQFKFIIGAMRTGGTYLYKELSLLHGQNFKELSLEMTHDSIPLYGLLSYYQQTDAIMRLIFEMAQFLTWVKHEIEAPVVVQKRIAYGHALPFMNGLFGDSAEYFLTLRHPVSIGYSFAKMENLDPHDPASLEPPGWYYLAVGGGKAISKEEWGTYSYFQKVLHYWERYYLDVAEAGLLQDRLKIMAFGKQTEEFLSQYAKDLGHSDYQPAVFNSSMKSLENELTQKELNASIEKVSRRWAGYDMAFPEVAYC